MVVDPLGSCRQVLRLAGLQQNIIYVPANGFRIPFHGIYMKVVAKPSFARQLKRVPNALRAGITGAVNGPVYRPRFLADILHDIDLAAIGPSSRLVAHHPKSRPKPLPSADLDARLEAAVALGKLAFGV